MSAYQEGDDGKDKPSQPSKSDPQDIMSDGDVVEKIELMKIIFDESNVGINIWRRRPEDEDFTLIAGNKRFFEMMGRSEEELVGATVELGFSELRFIHPQEENESTPGVDFKPLRGISSATHPDGKKVYFEWVSIAFEKDDVEFQVGANIEITERKLEEESLRINELLLRVFFDYAPIGIFIFDVNNITGKKKLLTCNGKFEEMLGRSKEELIAMKDISRLCTDDLKFNTESEIVKVWNREGSEKAYGSWIRPDGAENYHEVIAVPIKTIDEIQVMCICRDVTEQRKAESKLAEDELLLQLMFDSANDGINICEFDREKGIKKLVSCNKKFVDMTGRSLEELMAAEDMRQFSINTIEPERSQDYVKHFNDGKSQRGIGSWNRPDGRENCHEWIGVPIKSGEKTLVLGIDRDITERMQSEEKLQRSEESLRMFFENANDGISIIEYDPVTDRPQLVSCNDKFVEMSGRSLEELMSAEDIDELSDYYSTGQTVEQTRQLMDLGKPATGISSWERPDGKENFYQWTAVQTYLDGKKIVTGIDRDITEQRLIEQKLRKSEMMLRTFFENAHDGISICEYDHATNGTKLIFCNNAYVKMSGRSKEELMETENLAEISIFREHLGEPVEFPTIFSRETAKGVDSWIRPDGKENYHEWIAKAIKLEGKELIFGIDRDITDRKIAEAKLRDSEEMFRMIFDNAHDGINTIEMDLETRKRKLISCNDRFVEMSGRSLEELMAAENLDDFFDFKSDNYQESEGQWDDCKLLRGVSSWKRPDGQDNTFEWIGVPVERDGKMFVVGIDRDITEKRATEEELRRRGELLAAIFDNANDGINICECYFNEAGEMERKIISCNERCVEMSGRSREELMASRKAGEFAVCHRRDCELHEFAKVWASGKAVTGVSSWLRPDGIENYYEWKISPIMFKDKSLIVGIDRDITERMKREREVREDRERIGFDERFASLTTVSAEMAHELNQPLTVIRLFLQQSLRELEKTDCPAPVKTKISDSLEEVTNAVGILNRFRSLTRPQMPEQSSDVDFKNIVRRIVTVLTDDANANGISLAIGKMDNLPAFEWVVGDIEQGLFILIQNAIQAGSGEKGSLVTIRAVVKPEYLELWVEDDCGGVAPEHIDKLFEPFFTTKGPGGGTGLGLNIVERIARRYGGRVRLENKYGHGAAFCVSLPINISG